MKMQWMVAPISLATCLLTACQLNSEASESLDSPNPELLVTYQKRDLGACCKSTIYIAGNVFGREVTDLAAIRGTLNVRYEWQDPLTLSILACNASKVEFRSSFTNQDYTQRFMLTIENERPSVDSASVRCESERFQSMKPL